MNLRDYQIDLINSARNRFRAGDKRVLIVAPCGAGKTVLAAYMASRHNGQVLFLAHRRELLDQTAETFRRAGLPTSNIIIESVQTAARHTDRYHPTMIIADECHHCASGQWLSVLNAYPDAFVVGLTATPKRLDGKPLDIFDSMVTGITAQELIARNYLAPYRYYQPPGGADCSGLHTTLGDFDRSEVEELVDNNTIIGNAVEHYRRLIDGKQAIAYCATRKHSQHTAEAFRQAGINAAHLDADTPKAERADIVRKFRQREIMVLCNVDLLGEGFDVPACDASILLRPTQSTALYIQQSMRCMRYEPDKTAVILDHVGNVRRHGLPDDDRDWTLAGKQKRDLERPPTTCPHCYTTFWAPPYHCPCCGWEPEREIVTRELIEKEGELIELEKREKRREVGRARTIDDLERIAKQRGYKPGWVYVQAKLRGIH